MSITRFGNGGVSLEQFSVTGFISKMLFPDGKTLMSGFYFHMRLKNIFIDRTFV